MNSILRISKILFACAALVCAVLVAAPIAKADTVTFGTATPGPGFTGPVTEGGYTYSTLSGQLYVNGYGPGGEQDMEGCYVCGSTTGGVLQIVSAGGGDFTFNSVDFAAYDYNNTGSGTLTVEGYLGGTLVGTDTYTLGSTNVYSAGPGYSNWTLESASGLAGVTLDTLDVVLNASTASGDISNSNITNVDLTSVVPEPCSMLLMGAGLAGLGLVRRRRVA